MHTPKSFTALFLLLLLAVSAYVYVPKELVQSAQVAQLGALLATTTPAALDARTKTSGCVIRGALPDPACTPGSVFTDKTLDQICTPGYTKTVRNVPEKERRQVFAEYNIHYPPPHGAYAADHHIPLALGGNNDIANLWPEAADPNPGFKEKDVVEVYLYKEVCAGHIDLAAAQSQIAHDWLAVYNALSLDEIRAIKAKYRSWSN